VTARIRYYGFYTWLSWRYEQDVHDGAVQEWQRYIRRAEALCALVTLHAQPQLTGMSGAIWARRLLKSGDSIFEFHSATDRVEPTQYLTNANGAFGGIYGAQIEEIGLLDKKGAEKHKVPLVTSRGKALAKVFAACLGEAGDLFLKAAAAGVVSRDELTLLAPMAFSRIDEAERAAYEALLFDPTTGKLENANRRLTLELVLRLTEKFGRKPTPLEIRWAAYSDRDLHGSLLELPGDALGEHRFKWAVYHANDLLHMAYEGLFKFTLQHLAKRPAGLRPENLTQQVVEELLTGWGKAAETWQELSSSIPLVEDAWSRTEELGEFRLAKAVLAAADAKAECTTESARAAILLLAVLSNRVGPVEQKCTTVLGQAALHPYVQSLHSELRFLADHANTSFATMLRSLLLHRIIERHFWVAFQKMRFKRGYTFLLESQDGLLRTRKVDGPMLTNPRLESTIDFLADVRLLDSKGLTHDGHARVKQL